MPLRQALFVISLSLVLSTHQRLPLTAQESSGGPTMPRLATLPLLFEETPAGPVTRARGLSATVRRDGVEMAVGSRTIRLEFLGTTGADVRLESQQRARINRLIGPHSEWRTNIPTFGRVRLAALYTGIDAVFYGTDRQLEYDMEIGPGVSPDPIVVKVHGADRIDLDDTGQLRIAAGIAPSCSGLQWPTRSAVMRASPWTSATSSMVPTSGSTSAATTERVRSSSTRLFPTPPTSEWRGVIGWRMWRLMPVAMC